MRLLGIILPALMACGQGAFAETETGLLLSFDHTKLQPREVCDGSIRVSGGQVLSLEGVLLDQADSVEGAAWRCKAPGTLEQPGELAVVRQLTRPKAVYARLGVDPGAEISVDCALGPATVRLADLRMGEPVPLFDGKATLQLAPPAERLTGEETEDDYPSIAAAADGSIWVAWQAFDNTNDAIMVRRRTATGWEAAQQISEHRGDYFRPRLAAAREGLWAVWGENSSGNWELVGRLLTEEGWSPTLRLTDRPLNDLNHNLAVDTQGRARLVWQADTGDNFEIMLARLTRKGLRDARQITRSGRDDWEPTVIAAPGGGVQLAFDQYRDTSGYDVATLRLVEGRITGDRVLASSGDYEAHTSIAFDREGRLWAAWDNGGPRWGMHDRQNPTLHAKRSLGLACVDGTARLQPTAPLAEALPAALAGHRELPHLAVDGSGRLWLIFRHLANVKRLVVRTKLPETQSRGIWSLFAMCYADGKWSVPVPLPGSEGRNDMRVATCVAPDGTLWAAWAGDGRNIVRAEVPGNHDVFAAPISARTDPVELPTAPLKPDPRATAPGPSQWRPDPVFVSAGEQQYELLWGDTHRHTDMSRCAMNVDGSIQDTYRYAMDVAQIDFLGISDHDQDILKHRYDREPRPLQDYQWWQAQKLADLFHSPPRFTALYGYEHGGSYQARGGHKNIMYTQRGNPCIEDDAPEELFRALDGRNAVAIPHQLADGTSAADWSKWNGRWEPVAEMFQARGSYEYLGTPRMAQVQREGNYVWDALAKGVRVGVIASSDHGLTHGAYAGVLVTERTREAILEAMRARRTFAATNRIVLDLRVGDHLMGQEVQTDASPAFRAKVVGTAPLKRIDIISDGRFVYTREGAEVVEEFEVMLDVPPGTTSYFYLRCIQEDNEMAWSSPIWVTRRAA